MSDKDDEFLESLAEDLNDGATDYAESDEQSDAAGDGGDQSVDAESDAASGAGDQVNGDSEASGGDSDSTAGNGESDSSSTVDLEQSAADPDGNADGADSGAQDPVREKYADIEKTLRTDKSKGSFQGLIDDLKSETARADTAAQQLQQYETQAPEVQSKVEFADQVEQQLTQAGMSREEYSNAVGFFSAINSDNPNVNFQVCETMVKIFDRLSANMIANGIEPPRSQPLYSEYPDIKQALDNQQITPQHAQQLAASRMRLSQVTGRNQQSNAEVAQQEALKKQENDSIQAVTDWAAATAKSDPNWSRKVDDITAYAKELAADENITAAQAPGLLKLFYNSVTKRFDDTARLQEAERVRNRQQPTRTTVSRAAPQGKSLGSLEDVIQDALSV